MTIIQGHPSEKLYREGMKPLDITICGGCERMRTIMFLNGDRWLCTHCRNSGSTMKQFAVSNPARRRK